MRILVVGAGSIGKRHIKIAVGLGVDVGVLDPRADARDAAKRLGAMDIDGKYYDGVVIATPAHLHLPMLHHFARIAPVLIEKPLGLDTEILALSAFNRYRVMVGYMLRFHPDIETLRQKDLIVRQNESTEHSELTLNLDTDMASWPGGAKYGDMWLECSHELDLLLHIGMVHYDADDVISASTEPFGGRVCMQQGTVNIRTDITAARSWGSGRHGWFSPTRESIDLCYETQMKAFIESIRTGVPSDIACSVDEACEVLDLIATIRRICNE